MAGTAPSPRHGEVWRVAFTEGGDRPAIVVTRNELNYGQLILVVPCSTARVEERSGHANYVRLRKGVGGLPAESVAQTHVIQPAEVSSFIEKLGQLDREEMREVLLALAWSTGVFESLG